MSLVIHFLVESTVTLIDRKTKPKPISNTMTFNSPLPVRPRFLLPT